jgi:bacterioferritin-associated ferredoxin
VIVCLCANVSERKLAAVIADGATTLKDVERRCGAGGACGACRRTIHEQLKRHRETADRAAEACTGSQPVVPAVASA